MKKIIPRVEDYMESCVGGVKKGKEPKKYYPSFDVKHEFIPETKNWKVGKTYKIKLEVKMTGLSISKCRNDSEFEIHGYELGEEVKENSDNKEYPKKENSNNPAIPKV